MKDQEARARLATTADLVARQRTDIEALRTQLWALQAAYDALFDVVASDLGYEAVVDGLRTAFLLPRGMWAKVSPRQFAKTTPPAAELVRAQANIRLFPKKAK